MLKMNEKVKEVIRDVLMEQEWDPNYIKHSSYKYEMFEACAADSNYNAICDSMNLHFNEDEKKTLFRILERLNWKISHIDDYSFYS